MKQKVPSPMLLKQKVPSPVLDGKRRETI